MSSDSEKSYKDPFHDSDNTDEDPDYMQEVTDNVNNKNTSKNVGDDVISEVIESNSDENEVLISKDGKKRKREPARWKRNIRKLNRNSGNEYKNTAGKLVPKKVQGPGCQCKNKCFEKFTELERDAIFTEFYAMEDKNIQDCYLGSLIDAKDVKRRRKGTISEKKKYSYYYNIKVATKNEMVCRSAFCNMHSIGKSRVMMICQARASGSLLRKDNRGKHQNRPNKISKNIIDTIDEHIKCFPSHVSHYSRNDNKNKIYYNPELNVKKMYELYLEKYDTENFNLLKKCEKTKAKVTYDFYYRRFTQCHNISFGYPRSDTCSTCDHLKIKIDSTESTEENKKLNLEKEIHLRKAQAFYDDLKSKRELAQSDETVETICFDYQQNLPVPILTTGDIFYARQIWVFNQSFHSCSSNKSVNYMFDETLAKKGSIETVSFLKHFIDKYIDEKVKTLYIFTDNCAGQNKNAVMLHFLMTLIIIGRFKVIIHHLPEPGHSFLPCDRDFGQIEKKKRKKELLYVPEEWYSLVENCGKKIIVERVSQDMIFNFKNYLDPYFKKTAVARKKPFTISKYRIFQYSDENNTVCVTESHNIETTIPYILTKKNETNVDLKQAPLAYQQKLPLKYKKYDSIMPLIRKYVPSVHHPFYDDIQREENNSDSD